MLDTYKYFELVGDDGIYSIAPIEEYNSISIKELEEHFNKEDYAGDNNIDFNNQCDCEHILNTEAFDGEVVFEDGGNYGCCTYEANFVCKHEKTENGKVYYKIIMEY